jgi:hypothetical protein
MTMAYADPRWMLATLDKGFLIALLFGAVIYIVWPASQSSKPPWRDLAHNVLTAILLNEVILTPYLLLQYLILTVCVRV